MFKINKKKKENVWNMFKIKICFKIRYQNDINEHILHIVLVFPLLTLNK